MADTALLIIDLQNDYFPGGKMELEGADAAARKAASVLKKFRDQKLPVIHVRHLSVRPGSTFFIPGTAGAEVREAVKPKEGETVIEKSFP
ncbi:MAG: isochorismatase family protein, partial [Betaproteobacteria bacterium]